MRDEAKHPWIVSGVVVPKAVMSRVVEEARAAYGRDEESCGFLVGPASDALVVSEAVPMENRANGTPVKVLYHSHLDVGAYFSDTDAAAAKMGGDEPAYDLAFLVTSVRNGEVDDRKLFVWSPTSRAFVEAPIVERE